MKRVLLLICAFAGLVSASAQVMVVMNGDKKVAIYNAQEADRVAFRKDSVRHDYVEIGGVKWATQNLGATATGGKSAACFGDYYAWGEVTPRYTGITTDTSSPSIVGWKTNHAEGYSENDMPLFTADSLDAEHDAATQAWGKQDGLTWQTPSSEDFIALEMACNFYYYKDHISMFPFGNLVGGVYWTNNYNGAAGVVYVDNDDTSKQLFLPAGGYINDTTYNDHPDTRELECRYWCSDKSLTGNPCELHAWYLFTFDHQRIISYDVLFSFCEYRGLTIRPVLK